MQQAVTAQKMQSALTAGAFLLKVANPPCGVEYTELINKLAKNIKNTILRDKLRGFKHECCVLSVRSNETGWLVFFSHCGADLPEQQLDVLPKSPEDAEKQGFIKQPDDKTAYHRHKGQTGNLKYCHPTTGQEIIFNEYGKVVTIPENIGTKNYGVNPVSIAHVWYDILPYWFWGNSANDRTPWQDRVLGAEKGAKIKTFFENLQKNLDNILKQLNFN